ncbi:MAG: ribosome biogenesis factor YjgA [Methylococcaceae bacterium]
MEHAYDDFAYEEDDLGPSKSELKRQSAAMQALGEELMSLPEEHLIALDLPEDLQEAIRLGCAITAHGGLKRQKKFIGKLLRNLDVSPIQAELQRLRNREAHATRQHHQLEHWRNRLIDGGDAAIDAYMAENPHADRRKLRQLVRESQAERLQEAPPRSARLLFRYLRTVEESADMG